MSSFYHKAGVCFSSKKMLYIVDELEFGFIGGNIYTPDLAVTASN